MLRCFKRNRKRNVNVLRLKRTFGAIWEGISYPSAQEPMTSTNIQALRFADADAVGES